MGRRQIRRTRLPVQEPATEPSADDDEAEPEETGLEELQSEADAQEFDQTFLARKEDFQLEGDFSPAPFPLQVIPRVAYTVNYQMVYNEDQGRWEPQKKGDLGLLTEVLDSGSSVTTDPTALDFNNNLTASLSGETVTVDASGGGGGGTLDTVKITKEGGNQTVTAGSNATVTFDTAEIDQFGGANLANNQVDVTAGTYLVLLKIQWFAAGAFDNNLEIRYEDGSTTTRTTVDDDSELAKRHTTTLQFADSGNIRVLVDNNDGSDHDLFDFDEACFLSVTKLA